jgi:CheY-like chemotaxis protein
VAPLVLVVDDEDPLRRFVTRALDLFGYAYVEAACGAQACKVASERHIDVLLTDLMMPGMRGDELAQRLHADNASLKVIYLTGFADRLYDHRDALDPHESVLEKPVALADLEATLARALGG